LTFPVLQTDRTGGAGCSCVRELFGGVVIPWTFRGTEYKSANELDVVL